MLCFGRHTMWPWSHPDWIQWITDNPRAWWVGEKELGMTKSFNLPNHSQKQTSWSMLVKWKHHINQKREVQQKFELCSVIRGFEKNKSKCLDFEKPTQLNTLLFKCLWSLQFWISNLFRKEDALNWSKLKVNTFIMLQTVSISNKFCSFEISIHQRILKT